MKKTFQPSNRAKKAALKQVLYPTNSEEAHWQGWGSDSCVEGNHQALCQRQSFEAAGRDPETHSRSQRAEQAAETTELNESSQCGAPDIVSVIPGAGGSVPEDSSGLSLSNGSVQQLLPDAQAFNSIPQTNGRPFSDLPRAVLQGWHGDRRSDQVPGGSSRQSPRACSSPHAAEGTSLSQGLEELRSRNFKAAPGVASGGTDCSEDVPDRLSGRSHVCSHHVRYLLPSIRNSQAVHQRPCDDLSNGDQVVSVDQQIRRPRNLKDGDVRRNHGSRQQRDSMAGRALAHPGQEQCDRQVAASRISRVDRCLEGQPLQDRPGTDLCCPLPTKAQRGVLGPAEKSSKPTRCQVQREMAVRQFHGKIRKTCHGHAEVRRAASRCPKTSPTSSSVAQASGPQILWPVGKPLTSKVCLELFAGSGRLARKLSSVGFLVEAWDILFSPSCDLTKVSILNSILDRIRQNKIAYVHIGLPCSTWSRARRWDGKGPGPLRDDSNFLMGMPYATLSPADQQKLKIGNRLFFHAMRIIRLCNKVGVPWTLENPMTSRVWLTRQIKQLASKSAFWRADFCQYGQPWRKATFFLASLGFQLNFRQCTGKHGICSRTGQAHTPLQGTDSSGQFMTKIAEPYPFQLAKQLALAFKKLHVASRP